MRELFIVPMWVIYCSLFIFGAVAIISAAFFFVRRLIHHDILKKHHDLAGFVISTLGVLFSVFLGFTIVNSQAHFGQIIAQVNQEAYLSADLYRVALGLPEKTRDAMHRGIREYIRSVIVDEWPLMHQKKESAITLSKLEELWKPYFSFRPQTEDERLWYAKSLDILLQFNNARLKRIYSSWESLGAISWLALIIGAIILDSFLLFFGTENKFAQWLMNALFTGYFAFMLYVVYALDNPFREPMKITPRAYEVILNYYEMTRGALISPEDGRYISPD